MEYGQLIPQNRLEFVPERPKSEKAGEEGPLAERDKPL